MEPETSPIQKSATTLPSAGLVVVIVTAAIVGGWMYLDNMRAELEMKIAALSSSSMPISATHEDAQSLDSETLEMGVIEFDPTTVAVGDKVGDWTVVAIEEQEPGYPRKVRLAGAAVVDGTFEYFDDTQPFFGGSVIFKPDAASTARLPAPTTWSWLDQGRETGKRFMLRDDAAVRRVFGPPGRSGRATIMIEDYEVNLIEGEVFDTADFVRILER